MFDYAGLNVFSFYSDANNHPAFANIIHVGFHGNQFTNFNWIQKIDRINRSGNTIMSGEFRSSSKRNLVEQGQNITTMNFSAEIGMRRQHQFGYCNFRSVYIFVHVIHLFQLWLGYFQVKLFWPWRPFFSIFQRCLLGFLFRRKVCSSHCRILL